MFLQTLVYENPNFIENLNLKADFNFKARSASKIKYSSILKESKNVFARIQDLYINLN
ncbi:hypothetical protein [Haloimpatiens lingqiaonensis]|uniref:hypothetical protein n=1 Tax=Haloimpatiens lingqiaonensis TaxID=1380675 RepID=UPI001485AE92|nr:hypothetical protein [Haloimpatiens lingqiaonensis]